MPHKELHISPLSAFSDNYIWLIHSPNNRDVLVVDPGDAAPVETALHQHNLAGILITHHHHDHTGGIATLTRNRNIPVFGPANISGITHPLKDGDTIKLFDCQFHIIATPGHTLDHIAYFTDSPAKPVLFCGDTLFAGGCGRLFEGTARQMHQSLSRLAALPGQTQIYCAHEYTQANLRFAQAVEPHNRALQQRITEVNRQRANNQPSVPSSLAEELATNPFLRTDQPSVIQVARHRGSATTPAEILGVIRAWKDNF